MSDCKLRTAIAVFICFSAVNFYPSTSQSQAGLAVIAASTAVNDIIDNLRKSAQEILSKLDQSVSSGTFLAKMQATNFLTELDFHSSQVVGKTFGELDAKQQAFFRNAQQSIADIKDLGDNLSKDTDKVTQRFEFAIASAPFISTEPRLRSVIPRVVANSSAKNNLRIKFDGSWLANGNPRLKISDLDCKLVDLSEPLATFQCPEKSFAGEAPKVVRYVSGIFSAVQPQGFWKKIGNYFGGSPDVKNYPVSLGFIADKVGKFTVSATALVAANETKSRTERYDTGRQHCTWGSETTLNVSPSGPEWNIDVSSISLVLESGETSRLQNVTPKGFQVYAVGHNSGNCARVLGQTVSYDARGWANGHVSFSEFRTVERPTNSVILDDEIAWGDVRVVQLPEKTQSYLVDAQYFNGRHVQYNAPTKDDFLIISRDDANRSLSLSPRSIEEAFK